MSTTQNIDQTNVICGLKAAVTALECYHNAQILKKQKEKAEHKVTSPAVYITIQSAKQAEKRKSRSKPSCESRASSKNIRCSSKVRKTDEEKIKRCKKTSDLNFPEMRGGILYSKCWCLHRNGLQDNCPLSQCQGQPECLATPWAVCPPGKFVRSRYPELYPSSSTTDCTT